MAVVGEAASHLSEELRASRPEIPWRSVIGFRNNIVHEHWDTAWPIVEKTIRTGLPPLKSAAESLVGVAGPDETSAYLDQLFAAAEKVSLVARQSHTSTVATEKLCGAWMPIARARCTLPARHKGHHRSRL